MAKKYFALSVKRAFYYFPFIFLSMLATVCILAALLKREVDKNGEGDKKEKISIGLVGGGEDEYVKRGLSMLKAFDSSRHTVEFLFLNPKEAKEKTESGEIAGYVKIPEDFGEALYQGEVKQVDYIFSDKQAGIDTFITKHILWDVEIIMEETQKGIYAFQNLAMAQYSRKKAYSMGDDMALYYLERLLDRNSLYKVEEMGIGKTLSWKTYYSISALIIFFCFFGLVGGVCFSKEEGGMQKMLKTKGLSSPKQILLEYSAYLCLLFATIFLLFLLFWAASFYRWGNFLLEDFNKISFLPLLFSALLLTLFHCFLYEWIEKKREAILLQFLLSGFLIFFGGLIYPLAYMPQILESIGSLLPTALLHAYACALVKGEAVGGKLLFIFLWGLFFFLLTAFLRKQRIERG